MDTRSTLIGGLFALIGLIAVINPRLAFDARAWFGRQALNRQIEPGAGTLLAYRLVGAAFVVIGSIMLYTAIR
jgi:hypothetical protein